MAKKKKRLCMSENYLDENFISEYEFNQICVQMLKKKNMCLNIKSNKSKLCLKICELLK